jgi:hypothetical protein
MQRFDQITWLWIEWNSINCVDLNRATAAARLVPQAGLTGIWHSGNRSA